MFIDEFFNLKTDMKLIYVFMSKVSSACGKNHRQYDLCPLCWFRKCMLMCFFVTAVFSIITALHLINITADHFSMWYWSLSFCPPPKDFWTGTWTPRDFCSANFYKPNVLLSSPLYQH